MKKFPVCALFLLLLLFSSIGTPAILGARSLDNSGCSGEVYKSGDVTRKAKILNRPAPIYTEDARKNRISGNVSLIVVLCSSGKVTDIKVISGLPHGLTESCVKAAENIEFEPAERDGKPVSVRMMMEYNFDLY